MADFGSRAICISFLSEPLCLMVACTAWHEVYRLWAARACQGPDINIIETTEVLKSLWHAVEVSYGTLPTLHRPA
jgi:hypothetical protein